METYCTVVHVVAYSAPDGEPAEHNTHRLKQS